MYKIEKDVHFDLCKCVYFNLCKRIDICSFSKSISTKSDNIETEIDYIEQCIIYIKYEFTHGNIETGEYIKKKIIEYEYNNPSYKVHLTVKAEEEIIIYYPNDISYCNVFIHLLLSFYV